MTGKHLSTRRGFLKAAALAPVAMVAVKAQPPTIATPTPPAPDDGCPVVLTVWFGRAEATQRRVYSDGYVSMQEPDEPWKLTHDAASFYGFAPLWKPRASGNLKLVGVFRWAIDYVVAGDERMIVFGSFPTHRAALDALAIGTKSCPFPVTGYRIENEHCWKYIYHGSTDSDGVRRKGYPSSVYTDG